jgi:hypothetical protein
MEFSGNLLDIRNRNIVLSAFAGIKRSPSQMRTYEEGDLNRLLGQTKGIK